MIKALRWQLLLKSLQIHCSYGQILKAYIAGVALGTFTPGQLGDMGKVIKVKMTAKGKKFGIAVSRYMPDGDGAYRTLSDVWTFSAPPIRGILVFLMVE